MEQSTMPSLSKTITDDEREVIEILFNLPNLIKKSKALFNLPVWEVKGRRSAINLAPSPLHHRRPEKTLNISAGESSPATPLSFSLSQSDDKTHQSRKIVPKKKTREKLLETMNELVQAKESLTKELERVKGYYSNLEAYNKVLRAKQQQLQFQQSKPNSESLNLVLELSQSKTPFSFLLKTHQQAQPQLLTLLQQQLNFTNSFQNFQYPCDQTLPLPPPLPPSAPAKVSHVASHDLPDLNMSAHEALDEEHLQPLDRKVQAVGDGYRARAAEARKRRMVRVKERKLNLAPPKC